MMLLNLLSLLYMWIFSSVKTEQPHLTSYRAAVVELSLLKNLNDNFTDGQDKLLYNAKRFEEFSTLAKSEKVDIIVFPEYGLTGFLHNNTIKSSAQLVPDPKNCIIPCLSASLDDPLQYAIHLLSCTSRKLEMYLVVNLAEIVPWIEDDNLLGEDLFYNTQVVLDRRGMVIARYRKKHLFHEPYFTSGTDDPSTALFTTDFNVTFTLQICFDIMFENPGVYNILNNGIFDVAMSTAWIDELPFLTTPQIFNGWALGLNVNLLVSNIHKPSGGKIGSGIFQYASTNNSIYTYNVNEDNVLVITDVTTRISRQYYQFNFENNLDNTISNYGFQNHTNNQRIKYKYRTRNNITVILDILNSSINNINGASKHYKNSSKSVNLKNQLSKKNNVGLSIIRNSIEFNSISGTDECIYTNETVLMYDYNNNSNHFFYHENLVNYSHKILQPTKNWMADKLCHLNFCCDVKYKNWHDYAKGNSYTYMLLAYDGLISKGSGFYHMWVQECAVVFCLNETLSSCANINSAVHFNTHFDVSYLKGNFSCSFIYPSIFLLNFKLLNSQYWSLDKKTNATFLFVENKNNICNLLSMSIFSRCYNNDP